jgi:hypothetical protein
VAFFTPFFWSQALIEHPEWTGKLLDSCPAGPNKPIQMETQHVPAILTDKQARVAPTRFPIGADGTSTVLHRLTAYKKEALWDDVQRWFDGGAAADGKIKPEAAAIHTFRSGGGSNWSIYPPGTKRDDKTPLAWNAFATSFTPNPITFGYNGTRSSRAAKARSSFCPSISNSAPILAASRSGRSWMPNKPPADLTKLTQHRFETPKENPQEPRTTPDDAEQLLEKARPRRRSLQSQTRRWQHGHLLLVSLRRPARDAQRRPHAREREQVQQRVEKLHRAWTKDRDYLTPPDLGKLGAKHFVTSSNKEDVRNQLIMQKWLALVLLKNAFGGSSDTTLTNLQQVIDEQADFKSFPYEAMNKRLNIEASFTDSEIENLLATNYSTKYSYLILALLYPDRDWKDKNYHEDHVFPKSEFTNAKLKARGYDDAKITEYQKWFNCILNLELLTDRENLEKSAEDFGDWFASRDANFKDRHAIPTLASYDFDSFLEFIEKRRAILVEKLKAFSI